MGITCKIVPCEEFVQNMGALDSRLHVMQDFKDKLADYIKSLEANKPQNEKALVANVLAPFLQGLGFHAQAAFKQKGNSEIDLALLKDGNVEIIIEAKKPENSTEMLSESNPNCKVLHECILYYLREREGENQSLIRNASVRYIIITNFYQFYIFSAKEFRDNFENKVFQKLYKNLNDKGTIIENQNDFYKEVAKILDSDSVDIALQGISFDIRNETMRHVISAILCCEFLHGEKHYDSNALNPKFYYELLHIFGLREHKTNNKLLIKIDETQKIGFAKHVQERLKIEHKNSDFENVMNHLIIWLNRILFLKLIEANLLHFNDNDKDLRFLTKDKIRDFQLLRHLFFDVLAKDYAKREKDKGFNFLPYLNSSLFVRSKNEELDIASLENDLQILPLNSTQTEYKRGEPVYFLAYLFDFLECFDFGKNQDFTPSDKLIKSSVLGAMFEKLNGYQEGSFYTPNFITAYMCKESLSKIIVDKFNATFGWNANNLESLRKQIDRDFGRVESQAKQLLESIRICDPSVGSGHFLVSALNEMIAIYHHLGLLGFGYKSLEIQDDEILLTTRNNTKFAYQRFDDENHQIQIALFNLKKTIIENNLFGVDINPNSCNIARLRLWIELLKNAYYLNFAKDEDSKIHKLQTLPNIDINIKCGNSLISHFPTFDSEAKNKKVQKGTFAYIKQKNAMFHRNFTKKLEKYNLLVQDYKENLGSRNELENEIETLKLDFKEILLNNTEIAERLRENLRNFVQVYDDLVFDIETDFGFEMIKIIRAGNSDKQAFRFQNTLERTVPKKLDKEGENLLQLIQTDFEIIQKIRKSNSFEWRFVFPEVLDLETHMERQERIRHNNMKNDKKVSKETLGNFLGFDLVIGNPPYISAPSQMESDKLAIQRDEIAWINKYQTLHQKWDLYIPFIELGIRHLCKDNGICTMIVPYPYTNQLYAKKSRSMLTSDFNLYMLADLQGIKVFDKATVTNCIFFASKEKFKGNVAIVFCNENQQFQIKLTKTHEEFIQDKESLVFNTTTQIRKINRHDNLNILGDFCYISKGMVLNADEITAKGLFKKDDLISDTKDKIHCKEYIEAKDMEKYTIKRIRYLEYNTTRCPSNLSRPTFKELYENEKIFCNRLGKLQCSYSSKEILHNDSIIGCMLWKDLHNIENKSIQASITRYSRFSRETMEKLSLNMNLKYLLGILNSQYANILIENLRGGDYHIYPEHIRNLPIPKITTKNQKLAERIIVLVDEILQHKAKDSIFDTSKLESEIDSLVYQLYGLSEEEIKVVESKKIL